MPRIHVHIGNDKCAKVYECVGADAFPLHSSDELAGGFAAKWGKEKDRFGGVLSTSRTREERGFEVESYGGTQAQQHEIYKDGDGVSSSHVPHQLTARSSRPKWEGNDSNALYMREDALLRFETYYAHCERGCGGEESS